MAGVDDRSGEAALPRQAQHAFWINAHVFLHTELELGAAVPVLLDPQILLQPALPFFDGGRRQDPVAEQITGDPIPPYELNEKVLRVAAVVERSRRRTARHVAR